jgi:SAM-dependent MidA family methyltransferase
MASLPKHLPTPDADALLRSQQLAQIIQQSIQKAGGWISFADFMHMALYTPGLGYYSGGAQKFGQAGDFVTAPEMTPLFGLSIANQVAEVLAQTGGDVLELGAGTGQLALSVLRGLADKNQLPAHYYILDVSAHLRQVQYETLQAGLSPATFARVKWLDDLPPKMTGLVLGNEVLDALPVHVLHKMPHGWRERGVAFDDDFVWQDAALSTSDLAKDLPNDLPLDYVTEVCPAAPALLNRLAAMLETGAILLIDYGFNAREYYHPQRNQGTLMCHYQHYAHSNPLIYVGLQDITAHVNFSQLVTHLDLPCSPVSMRVAGHCSQAQFLINCGITGFLQGMPNDLTDGRYMRAISAVQKLLSPAEMGDLFKVIAITKNCDAPLLGFVQGDKTHTL